MRLQILPLVLLATLPFPSPAQAPQTCSSATGRAVALVLDASGSMHARLPSGESRIAAAQKAVKGFAASVDPEMALALRVYGAKSPAKDKNCEDSHLAVAFGAAGKTGPAIQKAVDEVRAQGWTPIAHSLTEAANDFPADAKERAIVLVSDGKETCKGDPVVAAKALGAKGIAIHTIGYAVDSAARMQLEAIARASGGSYFDAPDGAELAAKLKSAFAACKAQIRQASSNPGKLRTSASSWLSSHPVINAETGQKAGELSNVHREIPLPAGVYEVKFGASSWKGIEVRAGETTSIEPGTIKLNGLATLTTAAVIDAETGETHAKLDQMDTKAVVMPGLYHVRIKNATPLDWGFVKVDGGKTVQLDLAQVRSERPIKMADRVRVLQDGKVVARLDPVTTKASLPPGEYVVEVNGKKEPFSAAKGGEVYVIK